MDGAKKWNVVYIASKIDCICTITPYMVMIMILVHIHKCIWNTLYCLYRLSDNKKTRIYTELLNDSSGCPNNNSKLNPTSKSNTELCTYIMTESSKFTQKDHCKLYNKFELLAITWLVSSNMEQKCYWHINIEIWNTHGYPWFTWYVRMHAFSSVVPLGVQCTHQSNHSCTVIAPTVHDVIMCNRVQS